MISNYFLLISYESPVCQHAILVGKWFSASPHMPPNAHLISMWSSFHCMGCWHAQHFSLRHPARIAHIVNTTCDNMNLTTLHTQGPYNGSPRKLWKTMVWRPRRWPNGSGTRCHADFRCFELRSFDGDPIQAENDFRPIVENRISEQFVVCSINTVDGIN